ncbi:MAG: TonB-dependent receptor [Pseudomonadota bacterium]
MKRTFVLMILAAVFSGVPAACVIAADPAPSPAEYILGEVVVSGTKGGVEAVGTVREITAEDIQMRGAATLDEALALLPGVTIRTGADGTPRVDMRGLRSRHVLLLLDGVPFNSTEDGQFDPTLFPVENIARIKVSYGTHSVLYGDGGLAGTINIITQKGAKKLETQASVEAGERNRWLGKASVSGGNDKANFFLSGSVLDSDGYRLSDDFETTAHEDGELRENSDRERNSFFANVGFTPVENLDIGLIFNYVKGERGIPPNTIGSADPFAGSVKYDRVDDSEGVSGQLSAGYDLPGPLDIRGSVYMNQLDEETNRYDDATYSTQKNLNLTGLFHQDNTTWVSGGNFQTRYDLKKAGELAFGFGTRKEELDTEGKIVERKGRFTPFDEEWETKTHSAACEYELYPVNDLGIVLGYSHHWFEKDGGDDDDRGGYLIGAHYDITDATRLKGSFAQKIRFPSIRQLYDKTDGNPDLNAEKSKNYEIGLSHRVAKSTELSITGFYSDVEDYIEKDVDPPFLNHDAYRFQGVELTAETRIIENLLLRAGYTFMDSEDQSSGSTKDELQYRPEHKLTLEGKYDFFHGFSAYMSILHESNQVTYSRTTPYVQYEMNDFTILDARFEKVLLSGKMGVFVGAGNLLDEDYEESYGIPCEGRTFYGGIRVSN